MYYSYTEKGFGLRVGDLNLFRVLQLVTGA